MERRRQEWRMLEVETKKIYSFEGKKITVKYMR